VEDERPDPRTAALLFVVIVAIGLLIGPRRSCADAADGSPAARGDRALIVVGLPGDDEHEALFRATAQAWQSWLTRSLQFPAGGVRVLFGERGEPALGAGAATKEAIAAEATALRSGLAADGRLWVLLLGHGNLRGRHGFFHLPGPDLRDDELAALFAGLACREQVFWLTMSASGWFLPAFSSANRIVITATVPDQEFNETEFPHVLAEVSQRKAADLDQDHDGKVSVWELFVQTAQAVEERFSSDSRAPTEHAQLDDNGDQRGTEPPEPVKAGSSKETTKKGEVRDGELAKRTFLRFPVESSASQPRPQR
jgi:hypothetical protein